MIGRDFDNSIGLKRKCELLHVNRSTIYYQPKKIENNDAMIINEIREIYQRTPFYGYRRIHIELRKMGILINPKRVQRLLSIEGIRAIYPGKKTSIKNAEHKIFKYLLNGLKIDRVNQVWQVDITYVKIRQGFVYLICLIDVFSRKIMGWAVSTFLDTKPCIDALTAALKYGNPEIVNSDQGCQFTSGLWINFLQERKIKISMDGKGRCLDNIYIERLWRSIKYESVYLQSFESVEQAEKALGEYIVFYNENRPHQSLNYHTPDDIYRLEKIPTKQELFLNFGLLNNIQHREINIPKFL